MEIKITSICAWVNVMVLSESQMEEYEEIGGGYFFWPNEDPDNEPLVDNIICGPIFELTKRKKNITLDGKKCEKIPMVHLDYLTKGKDSVSVLKRDVNEIGALLQYYSFEKATCSYVTEKSASDGCVFISLYRENKGPLMGILPQCNVVDACYFVSNKNIESLFKKHPDFKKLNKPDLTNEEKLSLILAAGKTSKPYQEAIRKCLEELFADVDKSLGDPEEADCIGAMRLDNQLEEVY